MAPATERVILAAVLAVKLAVTVALAVPIVTVVGFADVLDKDAPVPEIDHELNEYPVLAVAVAVAVLPSVTEVALSMTEPAPEGETAKLNV